MRGHEGVQRCGHPCFLPCPRTLFEPCWGIPQLFPNFGVCRPSVMLVNQRWRRLFLSHPPLWRRFELHDCGSELSADQRAAWAAAKHRLLRCVGPLVRSFAAVELDPQQMGGSSGLQLPDYVHCLSPAALETVRFTVAEPLTDGMMAALLRFPRLRSLFVLGVEQWPPNATWVLAQLAALEDLEGNPYTVPPDALCALPSTLTHLQLHTFDAPLPDCRQLERLTRLRCLQLAEEQSSATGMLLPSAAAFPHRREAEFSGTRLQVRPYTAWLAGLGGETALLACLHACFVVLRDRPARVSARMLCCVVHGAPAAVLHALAMSCERTSSWSHPTAAWCASGSGARAAIP